MNDITEKIHYISDDNKYNQRFIVDIVCEHPDVWQLSKITRRSPFGTCKLGLYKHEFLPHSDYVNIETKEMYANYYSSAIEAEFKTEDVEADVVCKLEAASQQLKVGGSYKTIKISMLDSEGNDVSENYYNYVWKYYIDSEEVSPDLFKTITDNSTMKIKFLGDKSYLGKLLTAQCVVDYNTVGEIQFEIVAM